MVVQHSQDRNPNIIQAMEEYPIQRIVVDGHEYYIENSRLQIVRGTLPTELSQRDDHRRTSQR